MEVENETLIIEEETAEIAAETLRVAAGEVEGETLILDCGNSNI